MFGLQRINKCRAEIEAARAALRLGEKDKSPKSHLAVLRADLTLAEGNLDQAIAAFEAYRKFPPLTGTR